MEQTKAAIPIFLFLISLSLSQPLHYQTLTLSSLPNPQTLSSNPETQSAIPTPEDTDEESTTSLTLELHHRDAITISPNSTNPDQIFHLRLHRDALRFKSLAAVALAVAGGRNISSSVVSGLAQGSGEYFTRLGVGTPPKYLYLVLDTGSDVIWIQCSPCRKCYTQSDPLFDPSKSKTFVGLTCGSPLCRRLDSPGCNQRQMCVYQVSYGDGSFTIGDFSTETLVFRRKRVKNVALGCGHDNEGLFIGAAGLLGLGRGRLSFPGQTGRRYGRKFSYCLVDRLGSSKPSSLMFGESAVSKTAVFTPLLTNPRLETFYYIGLAGFSVGGKRVTGIRSSLFKLDNSGEGGVIIDSGTSVTRLVEPAYVVLRDAFRAGASDLKRVMGFSLFDTCFDLAGKKEVKVPTVTMHFVGADVALPAANYLVPVDSKGTFCFAFAGTTSGLSIIGNIQQQGFRVVFDLAGSRVGFSPGSCG